MFLETGLRDEGKVGGENVVGGLAAEEADEQGDYAFGDLGVGVRDKEDRAILEAGVEPDLRLAAFDESILGFELLVHGGELAPEANHVFVALGPVLEEVELLQQLLLFRGDGHARGSEPGRDPDARRFFCAS